MFGKRACDLVREVAHVSAEGIPVYNDEGVRLVLEEVQQHNQAMMHIISSVEAREEARREAEGSEAQNADVAPDWGKYPEDASAIIVHHDSILRNKRLLWTYMMKRYELIRDLRWQGRFLPESVKQQLSLAELQYFEGYNKLLTVGNRDYGGYMSRSNDGVAMDLTLNQIPKGPSIEVMVLEDYGEVAFTVGRANLQKGTAHLLPRDEVEPLLRSGVLQSLEDMN